ncbi:MAG: type II and III secretion system protein [Cyanobacteria bacterium J06600_6]
MTFADDFSSDGQLLEDDYPSAFGITFTPAIMGVAIAVAGITLSIYGFVKYVQPAQQTYEQTVTKKETLQSQLNSIKTGDLQLKLAQLQSDLAEKKVLKSRVLAMFTSEDDLETLLIDLNSFIATNQGDLTQYQPDSNISTVSDASLGSEVQGKLKKKGISLTFEGTFNETKQILQDLERLQPLLIVQSISSGIEEQPTAILTANNGSIVPQQQAELKTQIKLDAILPMSQAELERAKKADEQAALAEKNSKRKRKRK